jgi:hypothetical protein
VTTKVLRTVLGLVLITALGACEATSLMELNTNFDQLVEQAEEHETLISPSSKNAIENEMEYAMLMEVNQESFAANGHAALAAAEETDDPRNEASFLNLAARSYLKSGPVAEARVPDIAERGISLCKTDAFKGLNALPVTCGYFHIVVPQAVANKINRDLLSLARKARDNREISDTPPLSANDGRLLQNSIRDVLLEVEQIEKAEPLIDLKNSDPRFARAIDRQKLILFCNANGAIGYFKEVVERDQDWERTGARTSSQQFLDKARSRLGIKDPAVTCRGV